MVLLLLRLGTLTTTTTTTTVRAHTSAQLAAAGRQRRRRRRESGEDEPIESAIASCGASWTSWSASSSSSGGAGIRAAVAGGKHGMLRRRSSWTGTEKRCFRCERKPTSKTCMKSLNIRFLSASRVTSSKADSFKNLSRTCNSTEKNN